MSDTPRTDAELAGAKQFAKQDYLGEVMADFARQLERELSAATSILREICFFAPNDSRYDRTGYSVWISPDTAIRDINYRDAELWPTAEEAVDAAIKFQMEQNK